MLNQAEDDLVRLQASTVDPWLGALFGLDETWGMAKRTKERVACVDASIGRAGEEASWPVGKSSAFFSAAENNRVFHSN